LLCSEFDDVLRHVELSGELEAALDLAHTVGGRVVLPAHQLQVEHGGEVEEPSALKMEGEREGVRREKSEGMRRKGGREKRS
jgi:hypothetical protein